MFERYAIFYCPTGDLASIGASWLGWDSATGEEVDHPEGIALDIAALTKTPRKYGLHATLKAPFYLTEDSTLSDVQATAEKFAASQSPLDIGPLALVYQNGFIGLRPSGPQTELRNFSADIVRRFDSHRAPLSQSDIARRRKSRLTPQQDAQMLDWGYPYIFDDFHFHLTLTGRVKPDQAERVIAAIQPMIAHTLPDPFAIDTITIAAQDSIGMFHQIQSYALTG